MKRKSFLIVLLLLAFGVLFTACNEKVTPSLSVESSFTSVVGDTFKLTPKISGTDEKLVVKYASDKTNVATVANDGTVTTVAAGEAKITVSLEEFPDVKSVITVKVIDKPLPTLSVTPEFTVVIGETVTLTPSIAGTEEKTVKYVSNNEEVATVADGVVTTIGVGEAEITVSLEAFPAVKSIVTVKVVAKPLPKLSVAPSFTVNLGEEVALDTIVVGSDEELVVKYVSDNEDVATVVDGVVTTVGIGEAKITISLDEFPDVKEVVTINVVHKTPQLKVATTFNELVLGKKVTLDPQITGTTEALTFNYASDNLDVATVANGVITAVGIGNAKITVSLEKYPDIKAEVLVKVIKETEVGDFAPNTLIITGETSVNLGEQSQLKVSIFPPTGFNKVYWSTSNPEVVVVDQNGLITGVGYGQATITVTSAVDETKMAEMEIEVIQDGTAKDIIEKVIAYLENELAKVYVTEDFDLPVHPDPKVTLRWQTDDGTEITDNRYVLTEGTTKSYEETLMVEVEYDGEVSGELAPIKFKVVIGQNDFEIINNVETLIDLYFAQFDNHRINDNIDLITIYRGATISWTSNKSEISKTGEYTRPDNDTPVTLTALITSNDIKKTKNVEVTAVGYTDEEKMTYILNEGVLKGYDGKESNVKILFPEYDDRFGIALSYESKNTDVFGHDGKYVNVDLDKDTAVVFTVTFTYTKKDFAFTKSQDINITALVGTDTSKAAYAFLESEVNIPTYFPYGLGGGSTIEGLPTSIEGLEGITIEWAGNEEDFDGLTLKTQYMRYHDAVLNATFKKEGVEDTVLQFNINTGIAQDRDTVYIGGRFTERSETIELQHQYDLLNTFSYFDKMVGKTLYTGQQYWSYFSGYTYSVKGNFDGVNFVADENGQTFTYYAMDFMTAYIIDVDDNGNAIIDTTNLRDGHGGNWGIFFVNLTDKPANVPLSTIKADDAKDSNGSDWAPQGIRDNALTFDGYRYGFTADAEGNIVLGSGNAKLQSKVPNTTTHIPVPANGYGMSFKTQQNLPIVSIFTYPGTKLTIQKYDLAPKNDSRFEKFNVAIQDAKTGIEALEASEETTINVDAKLATASHLASRLTDFEKESYNIALYDDLIARSAALWTAKIAALKARIEEETYKQELKALYEKFELVTAEVVNLTEDVEWFASEYKKYNYPYYYTLELNGGSYYTESRQEVVNLFLVDLYAHLQAVEAPDLPDTFAKFVVTNTLRDYLTPNVIHTYIYEFVKDNADALTVDETGEATQFIRQAKYNEKWLPFLYWLNDTVQIGHGGGRDLLGRMGEQYLFVYEKPAEGSPLYDVVVNAVAGAESRFAEYLVGAYAYAAYKDKFLGNTWILTPEALDARLAAKAKTMYYTAGDIEVKIENPVKDGYTFGGWYLDDKLTTEAVLTPAGLGENAEPISLYAKWVDATPVE